MSGTSRDDSTFISADSIADATVGTMMSNLTCWSDDASATSGGGSLLPQRALDFDGADAAAVRNAAEQAAFDKLPRSWRFGSGDVSAVDRFSRFERRSLLMGLESDELSTSTFSAFDYSKLDTAAKQRLEAEARKTKRWRRIRIKLVSVGAFTQLRRDLLGCKWLLHHPKLDALLVDEVLSFLQGPPEYRTLSETERACIIPLVVGRETEGR